MTRGPRNRHRPSEEAIRRRLVERRSDYDRRQADTGWVDRLVQGRQPSGRLPNRGRPPGFFTRLRRRPITAYILATIASVAIVAALTPTLLRTSTPAGNAPQVAQSTPATSDDAAIARRMADAMAPVAERVASAQTGSRLRPAIAAMPETVARPPAMSEAAVAAALNLRLPPDAAQLIAAVENPDYLSTTGSVGPIIADADSIEPPRPGAIDLDTVAPLGPIVPQVPTAQTPPSTDSAPLTVEEALRGTAPAVPVDSAPPQEELAAAQPEDGPGGIVTASVNMRAKPENNATIVAVLEKGMAVTVIACTSWCEVSANGQRGFVFRDFVDQRS